MSQKNYDDWVKEQEQSKMKAKMEKFNRLRELSTEGKRYYNALFKNLLKENINYGAYKEAYAFATNKEIRDKGEGLYIYGECGTGKTHLACCIINQLMAEGIACKINTLDNIKSEISSCGYNQGGSNNIINYYSWVPVLVLDDIGTEQFTYNGEANIMQSHIFSIINNRYKNMLPTIYTSNYSLEELQKRGLHKKITDRMFETSHAVIEMKGSNKRI